MCGHVRDASSRRQRNVRSQRYGLGYDRTTRTPPISISSVPLCRSDEFAKLISRVAERFRRTSGSREENAGLLRGQTTLIGRYEVKLALNILSTHTSKSSPTSITFLYVYVPTLSLLLLLLLLLSLSLKNRALSRRRRRRRFHLRDFLFHALQPLLRIVHVIQYNLRRLFDVSIQLVQTDGRGRGETNREGHHARAEHVPRCCCCRFKKRGLLRVFCRPLVLGVCSLFCCEVVAKVWDENLSLIHI